jgi:hypothetical protein
MNYLQQLSIAHDASEPTVDTKRRRAMPLFTYRFFSPFGDGGGGSG